MMIDIAGRMTCGEDDRTKERTLLSRDEIDSLNAFHPVMNKKKTSHLGLMMHLAATLENGLPHILYHSWQLVSTYMRMGIGKDIGRGSMLTENVEDAIDISALLAARIEFAIGIGTCPTLTIAVVALGVDALGLGNLCQVGLALTDILTALHNDGAQTKFDETKGGKKSTRTLADNNNSWTARDVGVIDGDK